MQVSPPSELQQRWRKCLKGQDHDLPRVHHAAFQIKASATRRNRPPANFVLRISPFTHISIRPFGIFLYPTLFLLILSTTRASFVQYFLLPSFFFCFQLKTFMLILNRICGGCRKFRKYCTKFKAMKTYPSLVFCLHFKGLGLPTKISIQWNPGLDPTPWLQSHFALCHITSNNRTANSPEHSIKMLSVHVRYGLKKHTCLVVELPHP